MHNKPEDLLTKFNFTKDRKYLLIFDIDGTLRPDTIDALDHRHPKIAPDTARKLGDLNLADNLEIIILTARSYVDLYKSNFPANIVKFCGCGKQIIDNDILRYAREEFAKSYDETVMFIDILRDVLGKTLISAVDFLVTAGDFAMYFHQNDFAESKNRIMEKINFLLENSSRWRIGDFGKEIVFHDTRYRYDKGDAVKDIMDNQDLNIPTHVFMFGDSPADHLAMIGLRKYQKDYPNKRLKVNNIRVGEKVTMDEYIDFSFESYKDTNLFIDLLYQKIIPNQPVIPS